MPRGRPRRARAICQSDTENESDSAASVTIDLDRSSGSFCSSPSTSSPLKRPGTPRHRGKPSKVSAKLSFDVSVANDLQFLQDSLSSTLESAYNFGLDLAEAGMTSEFESAKETVMNVVRLQRKVDSVADSFTNLKRQISSVNLSAYSEANPNLPRSLFGPSIDACMTKAQNPQLPQISWKQEKKFVEFCESAWELGPGRGNSVPMPSLPDETGADDDIDVSVRVCLTCPVTLLPLTDPVRNTRCGHCYSREGISSLMTSGSAYSIHCPVSGCSLPVSSQSLVPDRRAEVLLKRMADSIYATRREIDENIVLTQFQTQK